MNLLPRKLMILMLTLTFAPPAFARALPDHQPVPGGVALVTLPAGDNEPRASFYGNQVMVLPDGDAWVAVVGIPLAAEPGTHHLQVSGAQGGTSKVGFQVRDKQYETQRITIKNKRMVNPEKRDMQRIGREQKSIRAALAAWRPEPPDELRFLLPVEGPMSSPFGLRRYFNDQPRKPHSGLDLAAPEGTPIRAPASGRVTEVGDYFFNGKTVFIDHGKGLVTMYCHMSRIDVEPGQSVNSGEVIGAVGKTGRVTGAHLHWGVSLNNVRVDPELFLEQPLADPKE